MALLFNNANWLLASACWESSISSPCFQAAISLFQHLLPDHPSAASRFSTSSPGQASRHREPRLPSGSSIAATPRAYSRIVRPFLQSRGINRLDGFILTHGAASSIGAARKSSTISLPATSSSPAWPIAPRPAAPLTQPLKKPVAPRHSSSPATNCNLVPGIACTVLFPPTGFEGRAAADKSLVLRIQDGAARVLLMSDSAFTGEHWLMDHSQATFAPPSSSSTASPPTSPARIHSLALFIPSPPSGANPRLPLPPARIAAGPQVSSGTELLRSSNPTQAPSPSS